MEGHQTVAVDGADEEALPSTPAHDEDHLHTPREPRRLNRHAPSNLESVVADLRDQLANVTHDRDVWKKLSRRHERRFRRLSQALAAEGIKVIAEQDQDTDDSEPHVQLAVQGDLAYSVRRQLWLGHMEREAGGGPPPKSPS